MNDAKFVVCIKCAHALSWLEHEHLITPVPCPGCGAEEQFGPGVYVPEFTGYTWDEVMRRRAEKGRKF